MSEIGIAWLLLNGLRLPVSSWSTILAPTQGKLPAYAQELKAMQEYLRRTMHLTERSSDTAKSVNQPHFFGVQRGWR